MRSSEPLRFVFQLSRNVIQTTERNEFWQKLRGAAAESGGREERKIKKESEKTNERMNAREILNDFV